MYSNTHEQTIRGARIHSLDAYRGVLMILGIVIHGALPFMRGGDPVSNGVVRFSFWSVHLFRMPAFFVLCGFFGALLWQRYGAAGMLMNRFERIALPLAVCVCVAPFAILYPVFIIERWYNHSGNVPADAWTFTLKEVSQIVPHHLWFLYYLVFITFGVAWWIHWQLKRGKEWSRFANRIRHSFEHPWRFVIILSTLHVLLIVCALLIEPVGRVTVPADGSTWVLNPATLLYYSLFYGLG